MHLLTDNFLLLRKFLNEHFFKKYFSGMRKSIFFIALTLLFVQCKKTSDSFLIQNGSIGKLTKDARVKQLDSIFASDSLVKIGSSPNALETQGEVEVYEKGGEILLLLLPKNDLDPNSKINDVLIYDHRFQTKEGLNTTSTFKDFTDHYTIDRIERILRGAIVFLKDSDLYLTIDSKYFTSDAPNVSDVKLEAKHIQETAPIKYLRINWDQED